MLDHLGLVPALRHHPACIDSQQPQTIAFEALGMDGERYPSEVEIALLRIAQEAVTNAVRHADAENVSVVVKHRDGRIVMIFEDDGIGFDTEGSVGQSRLGLLGMRERTEMLVGHALVESAPGSGTTVGAEIPNEG